MLIITLTINTISKQCVEVDAVIELDLVSALQVSVFPEVIFTKAGKILYREKGILLINDSVPLCPGSAFV